MKQTLTGDELIAEIAEVLAQGDEDFIAQIASKVLIGEIIHNGNGVFTREIEE